jgi:UDP-N-acetylglucosamine transferase subunit ALG13
VKIVNSVAKNMKIAKIVNSNSHIDYVGRVIDALDSNYPPSADDFGFAQFVRLPIDENFEIIGVIYDSILVNPEYSNFGPRLSQKSELRGFSPDYLNEQGVLLGILLLGSIENGEILQGVPRRVVPAGQDVLKMNDDEIIKFHTDKKGSLQIHYYSQIVGHAGVISVSLIESIVEKLCEDASTDDRKRLSVLKNALAWQRTVGGMRL